VWENDEQSNSIAGSGGWRSVLNCTCQGGFIADFGNNHIVGRNSPLTSMSQLPARKLSDKKFQIESNITVYARSDKADTSRSNHSRYWLVGLGGFVRYFWNLAMISSINPPLQIRKIDLIMYNSELDLIVRHDEIRSRFPSSAIDPT
jgi:hypothetical protein